MSETQHDTKILTAGDHYGRPLSIEDYTNRFFVHPLSSLVVKLALPLKMSANVVSLLGLGAGIIAGWLYFHQDQTLNVILAFLAMVLWHVFDGADGRIARATGTSSAFGRILDGICDHLVFGCVYFAFVFYILKNGGSSSIWFLAVASAISHAIQAAGYEERRQAYQRRSRGQVRDDVAEKLLNVDGKTSFLAKLYDVFQKFSAAKFSPLDEALDQLRAKKVSQEQIQKTVNLTVPTVRAWALLNANNRTIILAFMALIHHPAYYFVYEFTVLNIVFIGLIFLEKKT
ncbi:MAG TPA: CDP-alcohol phosphatidyltransferase family protein [Gammaproteobacteria bacterium]|nr:CDP-alcohol phosphatidyltransferase family protein [Gammaproteobacteria bacterium]